MRAALVAFALVMGTTVARAEDTNPNDKKRAAELAAESAKAYKRGELEVSVALLRQAYALYPEPNLLYNLARSLEGIGDKKGAVDAYEKYLASGKKIEDRGAIERRVETLKSELAAKAARETTPVNPTLSPTPPPEKPVEPVFVEEPASKLPWIPIAAGVAVLGGGATFGYLARTREDDARTAPRAEDAQALHDEARRHARTANILFAVGGVITAVGVVWEIRELTKDRRREVTTARARVSPTGIAFEWTFP